MALRRVAAPRRRGQGPNVTWARTDSTALVVVAAATKVLIAVAVPSTSFDETLRRIRGILWVQSDQAAANEQQFGAFGAIIVSDQAVATGVAAIPGPITDQDDDGWMLYVPILQSSNGGANNGLGFHYAFDSRAMRRFVEGQQLAMVVENAHASHAMSVAINLSLLASFRR